MDLKSRKLLVATVVFLTGCVLLYFGKLPSAEWVDLTKWTTAAYFAGNVGEHYSNNALKK